MNLHTHPCRDCGSPAPCDGTLERNHDGIPPIVCDWYHVACGKFDHRCPSCQAAHERQAEADAAENV